MAAGDKITEGMRILAALAAVAQVPTPLSVLRAGPGLLDSLKKIAASPPASFARLAEDLGRSGAMIFAALPDKPRDAEVLYLQMVEAGLPDPARIMADRMDAAAVTEGMLAGLVQREHRDPAMQALFRALTRPALERLLADKAFAADLTPAFMGAVLESHAKTQRLLEEMRLEYGTLSIALENREQLSRKRLEVIALRFGEPEPEGLSEADLETFLTGKAKDLRVAEAQLRALSDQGGRIANLKAAAEAAMADLRLDAARDLIRDALSVQRGERTMQALREDADLVEVEAQIALLGNDADEAARLLESAAQSFVPFDRRQAFSRRSSALTRLYEHGLRYGGSGLARAVDLGRSNIAAVDQTQNPADIGKAQNDLGVALQGLGVRLGGVKGIALLGEAVAAFRVALRMWTEAEYSLNWGVAQNNLGTVLQVQGEWLGGAEGAALFDEAVAAFRAALRVRTKAAHPVDWAGTQNNLGNALQAQGTRLGGSDGDALLGEAVASFRAAQRVWTEATYPVDWAMTQNNLGVALQMRGTRLGGSNGAALLGEAVAAFRAALRVRTERAHPVDWGMTQNNLGTALSTQGEWLGGAEGVSLLGEAVAAFRAALRVRSDGAHPVAWANTQNNLGAVLQAQGERLGGAEGAARLWEAMAAYRAALQVRTKPAHPVAWAMTTENLGLVWESLAEMAPGENPRKPLQEAVACLEAALRVYDPETMCYNHDKAAAALARVQAKLAGLPDPA